jgi:pimeloyl-ACP methyl ester carboxylesterase
MDSFSATDGAEIRVRVSGSGPPLVLLHEWASSHRIWEPFAHHLASHFTVYRWDARGHGGYRSAAPVTLTAMADDLAALLAHYQLTGAFAVGHSMGALTLWEYIRRHRGARLGRLCLIDQSPKLTTDAAWRLGIYGDWPVERDAAFMAGLRSDFVGAIVRLIRDGLNCPARDRLAPGQPALARLRTYLEHLDPEPLIEVWPTLSRVDLRPVLPAITVPTLLIYGDQSNYYPPETGVYVRDRIAGSRLIIYAGADHSPHVGQPARFVDDLVGFAGGAPFFDTAG